MKCQYVAFFVLFFFILLFLSPNLLLPCFFLPQTQTLQSPVPSGDTEQQVQGRGTLQADGQTVAATIGLVHREP